MGFRAMVGIWTSVMLTFGALFDACLFVDYITKFTGTITFKKKSLINQIKINFFSNFLS